MRAESREVAVEPPESEAAGAPVAEAAKEAHGSAPEDLGSGRPPHRSALPVAVQTEVVRAAASPGESRGAA